MAWRCVPIVVVAALCLWHSVEAQAVPDPAPASDHGALAVVERIVDGEWIVFHLEPDGAECVVHRAAVRTLPDGDPLRSGVWGHLEGADFTACNTALRKPAFTFILDGELTQIRAQQIARKVEALRSRGQPTAEAGRAGAEAPSSLQSARAPRRFARCRLQHAPGGRRRT